MINCLIIHPHFPGQFSKTIRFLLRDGQFDVKGLTLPDGRIQGGQQPHNVDIRLFAAEGAPLSQRGALLYRFEDSVRLAIGAGRAIEQLRREGWAPDLIYCHTGWGPGQFLSEFAPHARTIKYFEWYYSNDSAELAQLGRPRTLDDQLRTRMLNASILQEYATADARVTPTAWQRDQFPAPLRQSLHVVPDGVDADWFAPDPEARFQLPTGRKLRAGDRVITYVARGADAYRGFDTFIRLIAELQRRGQDFDAVVLGDKVGYYGAGAGTAELFEQTLRNTPIDESRVHFLGRVPYKVHRRLLQVSALHVFLSAPFVMSWSAMEALATGCLVLGWDANPLTEFVDATSALLAPPGDEATLLQLALEALQNPARVGDRRQLARSSIQHTQSPSRHRTAHRELLLDLGFTLKSPNSARNSSSNGD